MTASRTMTPHRAVAAALMAGLVALTAAGQGAGQPTLVPAPPGLQSAPQLGVAYADPAVFGQAWGAGARAVKILADWSAIERQRGTLVWAGLDAAVAAAQRDGLQPVLVLAHTPAWATVGTGAELTRPEIYSRQPPRDVREWERFVGAAAERFRGRVADWQVWTQIGLPHFRGTGTEYLTLLRAARTRLRAADASARVAMATPVGVDLLFITRMAQDAGVLFDAVSLVPAGFAPEALLRPLAVLRQRPALEGKAIWIEWTADASDSRTAQWARLLGVAQAGGVHRVFLADAAQVPDARAASELLLTRPYVGYLGGRPDVYALVLGSGAEGVIVAWTTGEPRTLEVAGQPARAATVTGQPVTAQTREGRTVVPLATTPLVLAGVPAAVEAEARANAARGPLLPTPGPGGDFSRATEVLAVLGARNDERGLYNMRYRTRPNGAVDAVEVAGSTAVMTSVARMAIYVYFDVDDTFLYFAEGRTAVDVVVEVLGASAPNQVGFNLLYDSTSGYRFTPWQWVEPGEGWMRYTLRLTDANFANTWGWDFAINAAGNQRENLTVRSVLVRKIP